jgi:hypothetical protein
MKDKMKLLIENWKSFANEEKIEERTISGFDPDQFPNPLPGDQTKGYLRKGFDDSPSDGAPDKDKSDDIIGVEVGAGVSTEKLMPSQNAIFLGKALGMSMVPKLSNGGDIGAVISEDNHILDGHHRWAATLIRNPSAQIIGTKVGLPIKQLIPVLRATGDAFGNQRKGEPSGGDLSVFAKEATNPEVIKSMIETGKYMDPQFYDRDKLAAHVESVGGINAIVNAVKRMQLNGSKAYDGKGVLNAPSRLQMPVLEPKKGNVKNAAALLKRGAIDVSPPYGKTKKATAAYGGETLASREKRMTQAVSENKNNQNKGE